MQYIEKENEQTHPSWNHGNNISGINGGGHIILLPFNISTSSTTAKYVIDCRTLSSRLASLQISTYARQPWTVEASCWLESRRRDRHLWPIATAATTRWSSLIDTCLFEEFTEFASSSDLRSVWLVSTTDIHGLNRNPVVSELYDHRVGTSAVETLIKLKKSPRIDALSGANVANAAARTVSARQRFTRPCLPL